MLYEVITSVSVFGLQAFVNNQNIAVAYSGILH